jgi:phosphatidylinositol alpha-1,6-mannosyltransferase
MSAWTNRKTRTGFKIRMVAPISNSAPARRVLLISKPVCPPFHDGSQVLVKELAGSLPSFRPRICTPISNSAWVRDLNADALAIYPAVGSWAPALLNHAALTLALTADVQSDLWHFVFAPNPRTCRIVRLLRRARSIPTLQTVASPPRSFEGVEDLLFGDTVVAQSEWTKRKLLAAQTSARDIALIRPPLGYTRPPSAEDVANV